MARKMITVLLYLVSVLFTLWGVIFLIYLPILQPPGLPMWYSVLEFLLCSACVLLGILSWKRAHCFRSTWRAFLFMLARLVTFLLAFGFLSSAMPSIEESMADSTSGMQNDVEVIIEYIFAYIACIFFGVTILLTLANKDKSANTTSLTLANKRKSAKTLASQLDGRYVIDPRNFGRDRVIIGFSIGFWLIWAPVTALATYLADTVSHPAYYLFLVISYLVIIIIPVSLFTMNKKQVLEVTGDSLVVYTNAIIPPSKVRIDKLNLQALTLGRYGRETVYTLNLIQKGLLWPKRIPLAEYVDLKDKAILFEEIREFLQKNGFVFDIRNEMTS